MGHDDQRITRQSLRDHGRPRSQPLNDPLADFGKSRAIVHANRAQRDGGANDGIMRRILRGPVGDGDSAIVRAAMIAMNFKSPNHKSAVPFFGGSSLMTHST